MKTKLVLGVGANDADYDVCAYGYVNGKQSQIWMCPYYTKWRNMLLRCYSSSELKRKPTYKECTVCKEWLTFSNFKKWMEQQNWEGRQLDKDFLIEGSKIYSPTTCIFIPQSLNKFLTSRGSDRGDYPLGVHVPKRDKIHPYMARCSDGRGVFCYLGYFPTPEQAHQAWLVKKLEVCNEYLLEFKDEPLVIKGLTRIKDKIQYHINTKTELTSF